MKSDVPPQPSTRRLRIAMGTWVAVEAQAANGAASEPAAIEAAYAAINAVERTMHPYRPGSDLSRINTAPLYTPIQIQPDTWRLLQLGQRLYDLTEGVFDPCLPDQPGRLQDLELHPDWMLTCHAPVEVDLGGIAKGYAIDRAIEKLSESGCSAGLVNAGGDLRVFGDREETILLRQANTARGATFRKIILKEAALAVSDLDAIDRPIEHHGYYNRTGRDPACRYAAVIAPNAAIADALTKCVLLCSPSQATRALEAFEANALTAPAPASS